MAAKYFLALLVACVAVQVINGFPSMADMAKELKEKAEEIANKVKEDYGKVEDKMKDAWENAKDQAGNAWENVKDQAEDDWNKMKNTWDNIKDKAEHAWDDMKDKAGNAWENVKDQAENDWNKIKNVWDKIKGKADSVWDKIKKQMQDIVSGAKSQLNTMELQVKASGGDAMNCFNQARNEMAKVDEEIKPKLEACMKQVEKDMEPMMSQIKDDFNKLGSKMADTLSACFSFTDVQKCFGNASAMTPELKGILGEAGQIAQMLPNEAKKAYSCVSPMMSEMTEKTETILKDTATCMRDAVRG